MWKGFGVLTRHNSKYLVVGRGLVGSALKEDPQCDVVSHQDWYKSAKFDYHGIVCAAAMSTEAQCQEATMAEVIQANVTLPLQIVRWAKAHNIPCVVYSTAGVYRESGLRKEEDDVHPHNRYTSSKIMMEHALQMEAYAHLFIFRIPFVVLFNNHPNDLSGRAPNWEKCEDVTASVVYKRDITHSVNRALGRECNGGVYNIATGTVHFPTFLSDRFGWQGHVVPAHSMGRTPNSQLDTSKAEQAKLLHD